MAPAVRLVDSPAVYMYWLPAYEAEGQTSPRQVTLYAAGFQTVAR